MTDDAAPVAHIYHCICGDQLFHPTADNVYKDDPSTDIPDAARLPYAELLVAADSRGWTGVARAAEDNLWAYTRAEVAYLHDAQKGLLEVLHMAKEDEDKLRIQVAQLQEQLVDVMRERERLTVHATLMMQRGDAALERERVLVEALGEEWEYAHGDSCGCADPEDALCNHPRPAIVASKETP